MTAITFLLQEARLQAARCEALDFEHKYDDNTLKSMQVTLCQHMVRNEAVLDCHLLYHMDEKHPELLINGRGHECVWDAVSKVRITPHLPQDQFLSFQELRNWPQALRIKVSINATKLMQDQWPYLGNVESCLPACIAPHKRLLQRCEIFRLLSQRSRSEAKHPAQP